MRRLLQARPVTAVAFTLPLAALLAAAPASCVLNTEGIAANTTGAGGADPSSSIGPVTSSSSSSGAGSGAGSSGGWSTSGATTGSGVVTAEDCHRFADPDSGACTACSCSPSANACDRPKLTCWYDNNKSDCSQGSQITVAPAQDGCQTLSAYPAAGDQASCKITTLSGLATGATCDPVASKPKSKSPWGSEVFTCASPKGGGGCGANQGCVPAAALGLENKTCVASAGTTACPAGFPTAIQAYDA